MFSFSFYLKHFVRFMYLCGSACNVTECMSSSDDNLRQLRKVSSSTVQVPRIRLSFGSTCLFCLRYLTGSSLPFSTVDTDLVHKFTL